MATLPTLIGPYRVVRKLGEGGMGEVYEGRHEAIKRKVAIKVLRPQYARDEQINQRFVHKLLLKNPDERPSMLEVMAELEQLQLRLGSASIQLLSAAPGPAPNSDTSGEKLSDSLAGILGQELENEELQPDGHATGTAARAHEHIGASIPEL